MVPAPSFAHWDVAYCLVTSLTTMPVSEDVRDLRQRLSKLGINMTMSNRSSPASSPEKGRALISQVAQWKDKFRSLSQQTDIAEAVMLLVLQGQTDAAPAAALAR